MKAILIFTIAISALAQKPYLQTVNPVMVKDSRCAIKKPMFLQGPVGQRIIIYDVTIERCKYGDVKYFDKNGAEIVQKDGWVLVDVE